jgi:hypothetical protein
MSGLRPFNFIHNGCQLAIWSKNAGSPLKKIKTDLYSFIFPDFLKGTILVRRYA